MVALTSKPKIVNDFEPGNSDNLPRIDCLMVAAYLITRPKPERNGATYKSREECYGDDAVGYVQLCRSAGLCTLKARVSSQPTVSAEVTLTLNEVEEEVLHVQCHDCEAAHSECMHGAAFLLWLHRRSEEPSFPHTECYWRKPKIAQVFQPKQSKQNFITTKQLSKTKRRIPEVKSNPAVLAAYLSEAKQRNLDAPLIRYLSAKEVNEKS